MTGKPTPSSASSLIEGVKSIAIAGVSSNKRKFGGTAYRELKKRGYRMFGVHPSLESIDGERCYKSLAELEAVPDCVLVCVKPDRAAAVVDQAVALGVAKIWFQQGADFSEAQARADAAGLRTVAGRCILMYTEPVGGVHRFHRGLSKLFGRY